MTINITDKNPAAFYIELLPDLDENNAWLGGLQVNIISSKDNPMPVECKRDLLHLSQLVASSVAFMEKNAEYADKLEDFIKEPEEHIKQEGNVIHFNFKTKGNA
tara:strand:+ start:528 stop:839 length:312 start_codon:yes stop_codon:yes gene_type:complete